MAHTFLEHVSEIMINGERLEEIITFRTLVT